MFKMASGGSKQKMSDETFDYICTSCAEENQIKEAVKYCVDCQGYCCIDCVSAHKLSTLKRHTLIDNTSSRSSGDQSTPLLPAFPTEKCRSHMGKIVDMYCEDHDTVGCYVCVAIDHKPCVKIHSVPDEINELFNKPDADGAKTDLGGMLEILKFRCKYADKSLQRFRNSRSKAVQAVKDVRSLIEAHLDRLENESIQEIEREYNKIESEALKNISALDNLIDELKKLDDLMTQCEGNHAQLFVSTKFARQKIKSIEEKEWETGKVCPIEISFTPEAQLMKNIEELTSLGKPSVIPRKDDLYRVDQTYEFSIELRDDSDDCCIYGSCVVDNTVLFIDHFNNKLKRVDISSLSVVDSCVLPGNPNCVCKVGKQEVAVACNEMVQYVSIKGKMALTQQLAMSHKCYCIAYKDDTLYITDEKKSLYIYNMTGNLLRTITNDKHGQPLFQMSNHIAIGDNEDMIFVTDSSNGLVCFDANCDHILTVGIQDEWPDGICVDGYGNVLVAGYACNKIIQFSEDGRKRGTVVDTDYFLGNPCSLSFHHTLKRMFVTNVGNIVKVYQLS